MLTNSNIKFMTLKQYQRVKLAMVLVLAFVFSQSIVLKNYIIPVLALIVSSLILLYLRRQVKEIVADERDYAAAGRAALLAIQIFSWVSVVGMFLLYAARDLNPAYEPVATTLAFATCILMLLYGVIFRYQQKIKFSDKRLWYLVLILLGFFVLAIFTLRLFSGEDDWLCQNGQWVKHGAPDFPAPAAPCR